MESREDPREEKSRSPWWRRLIATIFFNILIFSIFGYWDIGSQDYDMNILKKLKKQEYYL